MLVPFATSHSMVTTSATFSLEIAFCSVVGTLHVTPATLICVDETAVTAPRAFTCSGRGGFGGLQPPSVMRTASPAAVPPPILPLPNPPAALKSAERFASSFSSSRPGRVRPSARPTTEPWVRTPSKSNDVRRPSAVSMRARPETMPTPVVELTKLEASIRALPFSAGSVGETAAPV